MCVYIYIYVNACRAAGFWRHDAGSLQYFKFQRSRKKRCQCIYMYVCVYIYIHISRCAYQGHAHI